MSKAKSQRPTKPSKTKKPMAKSSPATKPKRSKLAVAETFNTPSATDVCPRGGDHEWTTENDDQFCRKCQEPAPQPGKQQSTKTKATAKKTKVTKPKKLSAINAAAQVLATSDKPLNCQELIAAMAEQKLWASPGGATPAATLYSAILREISIKGKDSRFVKSERGKFSIAAAK